MALAILAVKTLSTLESERRRFAFPLLMTIPVGVIFGKVYEIWNLSGLSGGKAMETAVMIAVVVSSIYVLYFIITYRIACAHVVCNQRGQ